MIVSFWTGPLKEWNQIKDLRARIIFHSNFMRIVLSSTAYLFYDFNILFESLFFKIGS